MIDKNEERKRKLRREAIEIAQQILDKIIDPISGSRELSQYRNAFDDIEEILFFVGVDSETDLFPLGDMRKLYDSCYLKRLDDELADYLADEKDAIEDACRALIKALEDQIK
jgi:hypothetical protein